MQQRKNILFSDINIDVAPDKLPEDVFSYVLNMEPDDIGFKASKGSRAVYPGALFQPEHLIFNRNPTAFSWLYAGSGGIGVTDGVNHFDITPTAGVTTNWPTIWTSTNLNSLSVINNVTDVPIWWDAQTGNVMQPLPNWPANTTCAAIRSYKNNLIALDIRDGNGEFSNQVMWSNNAAPGQIPSSWTPLPENSAGAVLLADTQGDCIDGQSLRDSFFIFKDSSIYLMNFIGGNQVFSFRKFSQTTGIMSHNCVTEYLNKMVWISDGDILVSDGTGIESLIDRRMRKWFFNSINTNEYKKAFVVQSNKDNQIWFCFPEEGATDCSIALVWDVNTNKFGVRDLKETPSISTGIVNDTTGVVFDWDGDSESWNMDLTRWNQTSFNATQDSLLQADRANSKLLQVNVGTLTDDVITPHTVERIGLSFGYDDYIKLVRAVWPRIKGNDGIILKVSVGANDFENESIRWAPSVDFVVGQDFKIDAFARGRFISIKIESTTDVSPWSVEGIDFTWSLKGRF